MKKITPLRITAIAGLILAVITCFIFLVFYFSNISGAKEQRQMETFAMIMNEYDILASELLASSWTVTEDVFERLDTELDRMEKLAISVESWLSVLKRRRTLSHIHLPFSQRYRQSIDRALKLFPMSPYVAALSAENLVRGTALSREAQEMIRALLPALTLPENNDLRLALHVLLGDFRNFSRAREIPLDLSSAGNESVTINLILLKMLKGDISAAAADIQYMFYSLAPSKEALRFTAEFFYDYGDLQRSAEIFTLIDDEKSLRRAADVLYLLDYTESARTLWTLLSNLPCVRSLYNLGVTSVDSEEAVSWFEKMLAEGTGNADIGTSGPITKDLHQFGIIHYSRLLELPKAIEVLEKNKSDNFYIDLELCRRQAERWELGRQIAETWLLLERNEVNEDLYRWAAWLFLYQRNFGELDILLNRAERIQFTSAKNGSHWVDANRAIQLMFEGSLDNAQNKLSSIPSKNADWTVFANLGIIMETTRRHALALEQYRQALIQTPSPKQAARVQIRTARCYTVLNRRVDAMQSLQDALELDPENITARIELDRL